LLPLLLSAWRHVDHVRPRRDRARVVAATLRGRAVTNALTASVSGRLFVTTIRWCDVVPSSDAFSDFASNHEIDELERH